MKIGEESIDNQSVFFIAEIGVNHNGDVTQAKRLIDAAAECGVDAVKFQTYTTERLVTDDAGQPEYAESEDDTKDKQRDVLEKYQLSVEAHRELQTYSRKQGVTFLSTPFDIPSADLVDSLDIPAVKIGSGELTNQPLLEHVAEFGRPMIVSTGMGTMAEVERAHDMIVTQNPDIEVVFLHCTSAYPTRVTDVNLRAMQTMNERLPTPVGYSDHTLSVTTLGYAVAAGATVVEKHLTLDSSQPGPDHEVSVEPDQLETAVETAREAAQARGSPEKRPVDTERSNIVDIRKSLHAATDIEVGDTFTDGNVAVKRPATGLSPTERTRLLGKCAASRLARDDPITEGAVEGWGNDG